LGLIEAKNRFSPLYFQEWVCEGSVARDLYLNSRPENSNLDLIAAIATLFVPFKVDKKVEMSF
jgi:hypothetical protein